MFVGIVVLLISIVFDFNAIRKESLYYDPVEVEETEYSKTVRKHIDNIRSMTTKNKHVNEERDRLIRKAWIYLIPGLGMVILFIIVSFILSAQASHCPVGHSRESEYCKGYDYGYSLNSKL